MDGIANGYFQKEEERIDDEQRDDACLSAQAHF
jgi:hypothetical protein